MQNRHPHSDHDELRIPPFEDSHMHFTLYGRPVSEEDLPGIMDVYTRHGIFSIRDMGHKSGIGLQAVKLPAGRVKVTTAGYALFRTGGYGHSSAKQ